MNDPAGIKRATAQAAATVDGDEPIEEAALFKRKRVILPLLGALIVVVVGAWFWYVKTFSFIGTDDAFVDADRGTISAKLMGRIVRLSVDEGDTVTAGDTLVKLEDTDLLAQKAKAEAAVRFNSRNAEIQTVNLEKARDDYSRADKQFKAQIATQEQFNHAQSALKLAEAQADMAQAQIATAKADLNIVTTQLANTAICAPFSGVIAKRWAMQGDVVQPSQAIFAMYDIKHLWVTANYEETKLRVIKPNMRVDVFIDAYPQMALHGTVLWIGQTTASQFSLIPASNAAGNFTKITQRVPVKIKLDPIAAGSGIILRPGLSATVHILLK
ncbi:MAG: HlyD family secretion protein [Chitinivibrionales bacterium]|nr:HlyD family secretion protein [Chitinivibrionales bacterium]